MAANCYIGRMQLILVIHNVRSALNAGSMLRTADGLGVKEAWLTGYSPYPRQANDKRLPHMAAKAEAQIAKTALGAEKAVDWRQEDDIFAVIKRLKQQGYTVAGLEQTAESVKLTAFQAPPKLAVIVGREVEGLEKVVLEACDVVLEIPMYGKKESFNVAVAAAIALSWLRFTE